MALQSGRLCRVRRLPRPGVHQDQEGPGYVPACLWLSTACRSAHAMDRCCEAVVTTNLTGPVCPVVFCTHVRCLCCAAAAGKAPCTTKPPHVSLSSLIPVFRRAVKGCATVHTLDRNLCRLSRRRADKAARSIGTNRQANKVPGCAGVLQAEAGHNRDCVIPARRCVCAFPSVADPNLMLLPLLLQVVCWCTDA